MGSIRNLAFPTGKHKASVHCIRACWGLPQMYRAVVGVGWGCSQAADNKQQDSIVSCGTRNGEAGAWANVKGMGCENNCGASLSIKVHCRTSAACVWGVLSVSQAGSKLWTAGSLLIAGISRRFGAE